MVALGGLESNAKFNLGGGYLAGGEGNAGQEGKPIGNGNGSEGMRADIQRCWYGYR